MGLKRQRLFLLILALVLIGLSWVGISIARTNLVVRSLDRNGVPLIYIAPQQAERVPGVLVAHGFAGSKQLMLGYGHVLAHAGYAVMLWDFNGHGANPAPLYQTDLQQNLDTALDALLTQPEVDSSRLAVLGHSMGSGIAMSAGIRNLDRFAAAIAISPTGAAVTPETPHNLQLQAGSGEGRFVSNAERLLATAGGANSNFTAGRARELVIIPNVEHITILFSDASHEAAVRWLDATFDQSHSSSYRDRRMAWYGLHLVGWLLLVGVLAQPLQHRFAPDLKLEPTASKVSPLKSWGGLFLAPLIAGGGLWLLSRSIELESLGGVQVGGAVGVWFLIAGCTWLAVLARLPRPRLAALLFGIGLFAALWIAFGAMAQVVWLQWWLIPTRLTLWLPLAIACFPWFLASGIAQQGSRVPSRLGWWLAQSAILIGGFLLVLYALPQLGFMFLLLPLFPPLIAVLSLVIALLDEPWVGAIGSACLFGWILAAGFPLSA